MTPVQSQAQESRRNALRALLGPARLDAILVFDRANTLYLTGFNGSNSQLLITRDHGDHFLTDFRYIETAATQLPGITVHLSRQFRDPVFPKLLKILRIKRLGFEEGLAYSTYTGLAKLLKDVSLKGSGSLIAGLRMVKDDQEIAAINAAQALNERMQRLATTHLTLGTRESDIRRIMRNFLLDHNAEEAFETIVAAGANSSLPHAKAGQTKITQGDYLLLDSGAKLGPYHSDMTRTFSVGKPSPKHREIYNVVLEAQLAALDAIKPGVHCRDIDTAARTIITNAGYREAFGHGTGHGVGLEIHEGPRLNQTSKDVLKPGMVVTVEPGIYVPGFGGVRIEDLVVVTKDGYTNLTRASKALKTLSVSDARK